jgi:hypothetical protein
LSVDDKGVFTLGIKLGTIAAVTFGVHVAISWLFGLEEVEPLIRRIKRFLIGPVKRLIYRPVRIQ